MPKQIECAFQQYEFTAVELAEAKILSPTTRMFLQNELAVTMLRKVALLQDPEKPQDFALFQAEMDGRLAILSELLQVEPVKPTTKPKE